MNAERIPRLRCERLRCGHHVRGQHDFETVEIWSFPSVEAAFDHWVRLTGHAYNEWFAFANNIGIDKSRGAAEPRPGL